MKNAKVDTQKIEARFEQVRAIVLAHAAFFVNYGSVQATWRTYRGRRLGPYFRVGCRQRSRRHALGAAAPPRPTSIYLGRSPELAARVRSLLDDLQQYTRCKRRCEELRRQIRRSLTRAKQELRRLLAQRGAVWTWYERRPRAPGRKPGPPGGQSGGANVENAKIDTQKSNVECRRPNVERSQKSEVSSLSTIPLGGRMWKTRKLTPKNPGPVSTGHVGVWHVGAGLMKRLSCCVYQPTVVTQAASWERISLLWRNSPPDTIGRLLVPSGSASAMSSTPPPQITEILETLGGAIPAQVRRAGRYVRRMTRRMPQFQSVWLDALVRYGTLSRWQASEIDAGRGGRLLLGPYALVEPLADCLYARAYRARHVESGEAVRVVVAERTGRAASETAGRLRELVEIAAALETSHFLPPNDTGQAEPRPTAPPPVVGDVAGHSPRHATGSARLWVASPWIAGQPAAEWLIGHGRMPSEAVLEIARAMTAGLVALEAVGLCHGDIGASSLWLADDGRVVLSLPGVRGILRPEEGYGRADLLPEAFDYLAPERVARGTAPSIASDLYASGCVWWHLLCGRPPLVGGDSLAKLRAAHEARIADPRELAPDTPPVLAEAILACTRAESQRRPHSAAELVALLGPPAPARRRRLRRSLRAAEQPQLGWPAMRAPEAVRAGRQFGRAAAASLALAAALLVAAWPVWRAVREKAAETPPSRLASMMHDDTTPPSDSRTTPGDSAAGHATEAAGHGVVHAAYSAPSDEEGSPADEEAADRNEPSDTPHRTAGSSNRTTPARDSALDQLRLNPRERLELRPGQRLGGRDGARVRLNVPSDGLHIVVEDTDSETPVFFEAIDFVWDPAGAAAVTVEAGNVSFQHCTFDGRAAGSVPPAAVRWVHPSTSRPDVLSLPSGTIRFSDCLFQDVAAALDCQASGAVRIEFHNVLHLGPGPLGLSSRWPRADESINLALDQVTVRGATALWRFSVAEPAPAPGRVLVRADRSVFAPTEGAALLLFRGDGNAASVLEGLSWSGEGALVSPGIQIVARETPGGMPEPLDDAGVPIAGLVLSRVEFAGPAGGGVANSGLLRWNAPLRTSDPPGCHPARLPADSHSARSDFAP